MKRTLLLAILFAVTYQLKAQYVTYTPIPYIPPPPIEMPKFTLPEYRQPPRTFAYSTPQPVISNSTSYIIQVAKIDGNDFSQRYINGNAGVIIYSFADDPNSFMNVVIPGEGTKSYGYMLAPTRQDLPATSNSNSRTIMDFSWNFANSYDNIKGVASCTLIKEYRSDGTKFGLLIQGSNGHKIEFYGTVLPNNN